MLKIIVRLGDPTIMDRVAGSSLLEQAREYDDVDAEDVAGYTACKYRLVHQTLDYELTTHIQSFTCAHATISWQDAACVRVEAQ